MNTETTTLVIPANMHLMKPDQAVYVLVDDSIQRGISAGWRIDLSFIGLRHLIKVRLVIPDSSPIERHLDPSDVFLDITAAAAEFKRRVDP